MSSMSKCACGQPVVSLIIHHEIGGTSTFANLCEREALAEIEFALRHEKRTTERNHLRMAAWTLEGMVTS